MKIVIACIYMLLLPVCSIAAIINVPDDFEEIQAAIYEAENGDTVLVQHGVYEENISFTGKRITVASQFIIESDPVHIEETIIDGGEHDCVVSFNHSEDEDSILQGFTIRNGSQQYGGGIDCQRNAGPMLLDLIITDNYASYTGGGIYCTSDTSPIIKRVIICGNTARSGAGIGIVAQSNTSLSEVTIRDNSAEHTGGGIWCANSNPVILYCIIQNNQAGVEGGGVYFEASNIDIEYSLFSGNEALNGSAISIDGECESTLKNLTITGNHGEESVIRLESGNDSAVDICLLNSIVWDNDSQLIRLETNDQEFSSTLAVLYSDVQGGRDIVEIGEECALEWLDGNIDEDPGFIDPDNSDYHLTDESPCIDTGDPESPEDRDGTCADIGAFVVHQGPVFVHGYVLDPPDDEPLVGSRIVSTLGDTVFSDTSGYWRYTQDLVARFSLTACYEGYLDSITVDFDPEANDTLEVVFRLLHSEFRLSREQIEVSVTHGENASEGLSIVNNGTGTLHWQSEIQYRDFEPWYLQNSYPVSEITFDERIEGVHFVNDLFYVSGGADFDGLNLPNMIYIINMDGELVDEYRQAGESRYGFRDLAFDGELLWGSGDREIFGFHPDNGEVIRHFEGPFSSHQALAWDPDREILWTTGIVSDYIAGLNREGEEVAQLGRFELRVYGLAYWPDDPDSCPLYIFNGAGDRQYLYKLNPDEGDTLYVTDVIPDEGGRASGCCISTEYDAYSISFISIANSGVSDRIDVWLIHENVAWLNLQPSEGYILPDRNRDLHLSIETAGLRFDEWAGSIVFDHNTIAGETALPLFVTIEPNDVDDAEAIGPPERFSIELIYPNPFNSTTTISYTLPVTSLVSLKIFDLSGREVTSLVEGYIAAGKHSLSMSGENLASGVYLLRMEAGEIEQARKVLLMR